MEPRGRGGGGGNMNTHHILIQQAKNQANNGTPKVHVITRLHPSARETILPIYSVSK